MNLYGDKAASVPQKLTMTTIELAILALSAWLLFWGGGQMVLGWVGIAVASDIPARRLVIFLFSVGIFLRMVFTMFYFMKRRMPWAEVFTVPAAFAIYYVGFALFVLPNDAPLGWLDYFAIALYVFGSYLNTGSELQRHFFKKKPENKGKLYTGGLFRYSMHINFFGDIVWVAAYALVTQNPWSIGVIVFITTFFARANVPMLDAYLASHYGDAFKAYEAKTKRLIPFIW